jgi:predicted nucleotidyltransferase
MVDVVKNNLDKIQQVCKQMGVKSLYLFGSGTDQKRYTDSSDLDFLYSFIPAKSEKELLDSYTYFDLLENLEDITGRNIDLVAEERIENRFFLARVEKEKIKIYES